MSREIIRTKAFVTDAADFIVKHARQAIGARGEFRIALSGGNTPRPVYAELAKPEHSLPWEQIRITFGDERCVPPDHEKSNYRMAREALLLPGSVPERSVERMKGEADPIIAAQEYEDHLSVLATQKGEAVYQHDLILLGLGDDGHTASLFPGTAALDEKARKVAANFVPKFDSWRLTFTIPLIAQARHVCFLVDGGKHPELIEQVLQSDPRYPAAQVQDAAAAVTWIIGEPASS